MTRDRARTLLALLPPEAPYRGTISRETVGLGMPEEVVTYAAALSDPRFGWRFVQSFATLKRPLPSAVNEPELLRAYSYLRYGHPDQDVLEALALEDPVNYHKKILVCCMVALKYDYSSIAPSIGRSEATCRIYECLFWPMRFRHRTDLNSLVYPEGRQAELRPGYALHESLLILSLRAPCNMACLPSRNCSGHTTLPWTRTSRQRAKPSWREPLARLIS